MEIIGQIIVFLVAGILINNLADVLPYKRKLTRPFCIACGADSPGFHSINPFWRCKNCNKRANLRNGLVLVIAMGLAIWFLIFPPDRVSIPWVWVVVLYLGTIIIIDLEHKLILHITSYAGLIIGILFGWQYHGIGNAVMGGAAGYGIMLLFYLLGGLFVKITNRSREEKIEEIPLGFGDVNLAGIIGLIMGFPGVFTALILAVFGAGFVSLVLFVYAIIRGKSTANLAIPYGPFLTLGVWLAILI